MQYADNVLNILFFHPTIPKEIPNRSAPKDGGMSYRLQGSDPGLTVLRVHHHGNRVIKMARADWLTLSVIKHLAALIEFDLGGVNAR
jgi:hypothetical protein